MGVKKETSLQERIQKLIEHKGGYVNKNWGSMVSEPGIADLTVCYKGFYLSIEVKVDGNKPSKAQGIHARKVDKAGGISVVVWSLEEVETVLDVIDQYFDIHYVSITVIRDSIHKKLDLLKIDNGTRY